MTIAAAIQMASGPNTQANLLQAEQLLAQAAEAGAELAVLPENFAFMSGRETDKLKIAERDGAGPLQDFLSRQAAEHRFLLVGGTIPLRAEDNTKARAACLLYSAAGERLGRYDKMHLFDVDIPDSQERYLESEALEAGDAPAFYHTPHGKLAVAVCYDLRFPEYFRGAATERAEIIAAPSAFTAQTGRAHWEVLLRARAIENLAFVVAAAQGGFHVGGSESQGREGHGRETQGRETQGRETWGHSMIIDPWGNIMSRLDKGPGVITAKLDRERLQVIRKAFPALEHQRVFCG